VTFASKGLGGRRGWLLFDDDLLEAFSGLHGSYYSSAAQVEGAGYLNISDRLSPGFPYSCTHANAKLTPAEVLKKIETSGVVKAGGATADFLR